MADIALRTANKIENVQGSPSLQLTLPAGANIVAGQAVSIDATTGNFVLATNARVYGIALHTKRTGEGLTAVRVGILEGYVLDAVAYDADVFLGGLGQAGGTATGNLNAVAGTPSVRVGRVIPGTYNRSGASPDKLLFVDCQQ
jgi:hypothetical protein